MKGKVYLIGMGPGDPELITIKAVKAIKACDVLIYDRLVNPLCLNYNNDAERIFVGKASRNHTKTQDEINDILVKKAQEGLIVGRLKGGDPFVFGRGGEEALYLKKHGIDYDIVPGITSAIAVAESAGIPVTHRGVASSFHVITGHGHGEISTLNWTAFAQLEGTLIFLMGVENLNIITENLMSEGKDKNCPAAVIMKGTTYAQREVFGTLEDIGEKCTKEGIRSPAVIIIGDVVKLGNLIGDKKTRPLNGLRIILTRPYHKSDFMKDALEALGAQVQVLPSIEISSKEVQLSKDEINQYHAFVFSSSHGVKYFIENLKQSSVDIRGLRGKLYGVGASIKKELEANGLMGCIIPQSQYSEAMAELINAEMPSGSNIMVVRGNLGGDKLIKSLKGFCVKSVQVYETREGCLNKGYTEADMVVFTSPSCVRGFLMENDINKFRDKLVLCIGKTTLEEVNKVGFNNACMPELCSEGALVEWILDWRKNNA